MCVCTCKYSSSWEAQTSVYVCIETNKCVRVYAHVNIYVWDIFTYIYVIHVVCDVYHIHTIIYKYTHTSHSSVLFVIYIIYITAYTHTYNSVLFVIYIICKTDITGVFVSFVQLAFFFLTVGGLVFRGLCFRVGLRQGVQGLGFKKGYWKSAHWKKNCTVIEEIQKLAGVCICMYVCMYDQSNWEI